MAARPSVASPAVFSIQASRQPGGEDLALLVRLGAGQRRRWPTPSPTANGRIDRPPNVVVAEHAHHQEGYAAQSLNRLAASATNHCLTGCLIGEVTGMMIATALGWGNAASIGLAVGLAFLFGYTLTSMPLIRAGLALTAIIPIALAADTVSIAIMEFIDNLFVVLVPGAMEAGLKDARFWLPLLGGFALAWPFAFLVNRAMIRRGRGHAVVHEYH
jgi:uncharacterized protein DUF4396